MGRGGQAAQLCIELSVKGILKLFDIEYPPTHDVSEKLRVVPKKVDGVPDHVMQSIARSIVCSRLWEPAHSLTVYGELGFSASRLFKEADSKAATECASEANSCLHALLHLARTG
jgi:HEPN domain-containing protein